MGDQPAIERGLVERQDIGQLVHLVAGLGRAQAGGNIRAAAPSRREAPPAAAGRPGDAGRRAPSRAPLQTPRPKIAVVAGEHLVAAVARQRHGDMLAGQPGQQQGGQLRTDRRMARRRIRPGWAPDRGPRRAQGEFGVFGSEMARHRGGVRRFRRIPVIEADREGPHPGAASWSASGPPPSMNRCRRRETRQAAHRRPSGGGRLAEQCLQPVDRLGLVHRCAGGEAGPGHRGHSRTGDP